ncbi:hypothetical protein H6F89_26585 [Cyanobacteria bacterium FACHB-63]|nr:hypothetical protein [Cyanobacteria bacterium FACHB-63]
MLPLTSSSSIQQYVGHLHQQMMDRSSPPVGSGYASEAEVSPAQSQIVQSLKVEVTLSRQFRGLS